MYCIQTKVVPNLQNSYKRDFTFKTAAILPFPYSLDDADQMLCTPNCGCARSPTLSDFSKPGVSAGRSRPWLPRSKGCFASGRWFAQERFYGNTVRTGRYGSIRPEYGLDERVRVQRRQISLPRSTRRALAGTNSFHYQGLYQHAFIYFKGQRARKLRRQFDKVYARVFHPVFWKDHFARACFAHQWVTPRDPLPVQFVWIPGL